MKKVIITILGTAIFFACGRQEREVPTTGDRDIAVTKDIGALLGKYEPVTLEADLTGLTESQRKVIPKLIETANVMDDLFWELAYGKKDSLLNAVADVSVQKFIHINYGPWDRLDNNAPFLLGVSNKPAGANFYPADITKSEFDSAEIKDKTSLYTLIRRDKEGNLTSIPYSVAFRDKLEKAAQLLREAAEITENEEFSRYLNLRAEALLTDDYYESNMAWMDMTSNTLDIITGPIETYEDQLYGYKAAFTTYVLIKDKEWSRRLDKYAGMLSELQQGLPVAEEYKQEVPGRESQLNVYDIIYYAGDCNAGSKTIAVNLPNDERVQLEKGTRRSQLKNAMRAKFDKILLPISEVLIDPEQRQYITFDAFFGNTMFHEVAHGLGIKRVVNNTITVREALKEHSSAIEEGKADILGLYMVTALHEQGEISEDLMNHYVTFMSSIFRSLRFGASSAHGKANMIRFNYFKEVGAFTRDASTGTYSVNFDRMQEAMNDLSEKILTIQGDGDYDEAAALVRDKAVIDNTLQSDLGSLSRENIPVDIVFNQGLDVLGLE